MSAPTLVVFDLGGVVVRICRSWGEGCAAAGLPVRDGAIDPEMTAARRELSSRYQLGDIACDEFFQGIAGTTGGAYTADEVRAIHDAWLLGEYPGVDSVIHALHDAGVATAVLSNTNQRHWSEMERRYRTPWLVKHPHASHLLRLAKPDPAIYAEFQRRVGYAADAIGGAGRRPRDILFFDDLAENITAAEAAGWRSRRIDHEGDPAAQMIETLRAMGMRI